MKTILTGVKPTGEPHIGNYLGVIRPALAQAQMPDMESFFFIADYHAMTSVLDPKSLGEWVYDIAASWLACGLDPEKTVIYRQSQVPETFELHWVLSCVSPKGFMNRAHAYKAKVQENKDAGRDEEDFGVNMGLYTYPLLMSADILLFDTDFVPVGEDQLQHVEFARDFAQKFNHQFGEVLKIPKPLIQKQTKLVLGLDGRKMSKSYGNHIPMFLEEKKLKSLVMKIKTDSSPPDAPKSTADSILFGLYKEWATAEEILDMEKRYATGIGWGHVKEALFQVMNREITPMRARYENLMANRSQIDAILASGREKAQLRARTVMSRVRKAIGIA